MGPLFSQPAGLRVLESLRTIFENKPLFIRNSPFFAFVCGGKLGQEGNLSLRQQFIDWAEQNLPNFVCLLAEDALKDGFRVGRRRFIDLAKFETLIADIADCVLIFPESPGSFAEIGFFSNSRRVRDKVLVINHIDQQSDSFINLGPIHAIDRSSFLKPTVLVNSLNTPDFGALGERLTNRVRETHRDQLEYREFKRLNFKEKLAVILEILRMLRLADFTTLEHAIAVCFVTNPQREQLSDLLRILLAAKFVKKEPRSPYFRVDGDVKLLDIENVNIEQAMAQVTLFYERHADHVFDALAEVQP